MNDIEEIVHVIPMGHEFDRVVKPFERLRANRAYILTILKMAGIKSITEEMYKKQQYFLERVVKTLTDKGIEVVIKHANIFDLLDTMKSISCIIRSEKKKGSIVYVNISGAGRLTSVAATLAAMVHEAKAYYVIADRYAKNENEELAHGLSICEALRFINITNLRMILPDEISWQILAKLCRSNEGMEIGEIISYLGKTLSLKEFDKSTIVNKVKLKMEMELRKKGKFTTQQDIERQAERYISQLVLNRLNKKFLNKLEHDGYIKREKIGRKNMIKITEAGQYMAYISGFLDAEEEDTLLN